MLEPIVQFFTRAFQAIGRGIGFVVGIVLWPFTRLGHWYTQRGWILKGLLGLLLLGLIFLYGYFFWVTQVWTNFNPSYATAYDLKPKDGATPAQPSGGGIVSTEDEPKAAEEAET